MIILIIWIICGLIGFYSFIKKDGLSKSFPELDAGGFLICIVGGPIVLILALLTEVFDKIN